MRNSVSLGDLYRLRALSGSWLSEEDDDHAMVLRCQRTRCPAGELEARGARLLPTTDLELPLLHEAVVLPQQQVLLHLRHRVERNADDDEE